MGVPNTMIAERLGVSEHTVRHHLKQEEKWTPSKDLYLVTKQEEERKKIIMDVLDIQIEILTKKLLEAKDIKIENFSDFVKVNRTLLQAVALRDSIYGGIYVDAKPQEYFNLTKLTVFNEMSEELRRKILEQLIEATEPQAE